MEDYQQYIESNRKAAQVVTVQSYDEIIIDLSLYYVNEYKSNGKDLINCFVKYKSIRQAFELITGYYKKIGAFADCLKTGKDFTTYCERFNLPENDKTTLAEMLLIIYSVTH